MNVQISRLALVGLALMAALILGTTYWQAWASGGLADRQDNAIQRVAQFTIERGKIYAGDGHTLLATNVRKRVGGQTLYFRRYPTGPLVPEVVGYSTQSPSQAGLERSYNDYLTGSNSKLSTVFHPTFDRLKGVTVKGNKLYTTTDPRAQRLANQLPAGQCAAPVALEPSTRQGFVLA